MKKIYSDISADQDNSKIIKVPYKSEYLVRDLLINNDFYYFAAQIEGYYHIYLFIDTDKKDINGEICYVYDDYSEAMIMELGKFNGDTLTMREILEYGKEELEHWKEECENGNLEYDLEQYKEYEKGESEYEKAI